MSPPVLTDEERTAAFAGQAPRMSRAVIVGTLVVCVLFGLVGILLERFLGGTSVAAAPPATGTEPPTLVTIPSGVYPGLPPSLGAMMQLRGSTGTAAPAFDLTSTAGRRVSLASFRNKVVVLWFFDAACDDICPVAEREIADAAGELGAAAGRVAFVAVNTDPLATSAAAARPAVRAMARVRSFHYLTGSLAALDAVWTSYGVTVEVQRPNGLVSHNELVYFISTSGRLIAEATPFADQMGSRTYVLPATTAARFAAGVADEARWLASKGHP